MPILKPRGTSLTRIAKPEGLSLTASGLKVSRRNASQFRRLIQPWQESALMFYATVGECWYGAQFYARALSKLRVYAAVRDDQGEIKEIENPSDEACTALARVQDRNGGTGQLFGSYGRLMFLTGEGYLTVTTDSQDPEDEEWEFLSSDELRVSSGGGYVRYRAPGVDVESLNAAPDEDYVPIQGADKDGNELPKQAVVYRLWRRHPQYSFWADSPMHGVLNLFEELSLLQLAVGARAKSRAAGAGILYVPTELSFGSADGQRNDDPNVDPFQRALQEVMTAAIQTPGSASAVAPLVLRGPAQIGGVPAKDALFMLQIHDPTQTYPETGLRDECIKRIATGLDMPPELLLGMTDANHWTAWQIDDATWTAHLQPVAEQLASDLNSAYLRPYLKEQGYANWQNIVIGYDAADIINHPDRVGDAKDLYEKGAIGYEKLREVAGFLPTDAQTTEEHDEWLAIKLHDKTFILDTGGVDVLNKVDETPGAGIVTEKTSAADEGPPDEPLVNEDQNLSIGASALVTQVVTAADMTVERIRELAGSRIRGKASKCDDCQQLITPVTNGLVASALGEHQVVQLIGDMSLTAGGTEMFRSALSKWGVDQAATDRLAKLVEAHAIQSLYDPVAKSFPPRFTEYVRKVLA